MATQTNGSTGVEHANADVIAGLRECADWLEQHPELPRAEYSSVSFGYSIKGPDARERLTDLAEALGDRAVERRYRDNVSIEGKFGAVKVHADADNRELVAAAPVPEPEPIIARDEVAA